MGEMKRSLFRAIEAAAPERAPSSSRGGATTWLRQGNALFRPPRSVRSGGRRSTGDGSVAGGGGGGGGAPVVSERRLLEEVFPPHVAQQLRQGRKVEPEMFSPVTIFFSCAPNHHPIVSHSCMRRNLE